MNRQKEARGQGGLQESTSKGTYGSNDAAALPRTTPLFDDACLLADAGYELIPLRAGSKAPRDKEWTRRRYNTKQVIAEARQNAGNLGVRLRPTDLVVDVDPRNGGDDSLKALAADAGLSLDHYPHVLTGGGGHHYYMRKPADIRTVGKLAGYPGIDFKTAGGQVVAPGAVHPDTGRRYEADFWLLGPNETPEAPASLLEMLQVCHLKKPEGSGHDRWGELTPEMLEANLELLDPNEFKGEDWKDLMMACHHATAGEGRQEFIDWSTQAAGYEDHAYRIGNRWDSLHSTPSH
ncbi:MAG TPA: transcriptional regulator, partial [Pseudomonas sp.]|nr:transcriptional regulator [Pseudomonas sp.]